MSVSPPFSITETSPQATSLISSFPADEQAFRDTVESWLSFISDPTTGLIRESALPASQDFTSTDAGAGEGPLITLYRDSSTPAANDLGAAFAFDGNSSTDVERTFAKIGVKFLDMTNASEDGELFFSRIIAGTLTKVFSLVANGASAWNTAGTVETTLAGNASDGSVGTSTNHDMLVKRNATTVATFGSSTVTFASNYSLTFAGTGAATTRTNLGLGSIATQNSNNVTITGGSVSGITDITVADGGTGASTAAAARTNLGVDTEVISGMVLVPANQDYILAIKMPYAGTITNTVTKCSSGTATATFKINTTALGGTANAVSTSEVDTTQSSSNTFSAGDDIVMTISSNSACLNLAYSVAFTRG